MGTGLGRAGQYAARCGSTRTRSGFHFWALHAPRKQHRFSKRKTGTTFPRDASIGPKSGPHFWDPSDAPLLQAAHRSVRKTGPLFRAMRASDPESDTPLGSIRCSLCASAHRSARKTGATFPRDALASLDGGDERLFQGHAQHEPSCPRTAMKAGPKRCASPGWRRGTARERRRCLRDTPSTAPSRALSYACACRIPQASFGQPVSARCAKLRRRYRRIVQGGVTVRRPARPREVSSCALPQQSSLGAPGRRTMAARRSPPGGRPCFRFFRT